MRNVQEKKRKEQWAGENCCQRVREAGGSLGPGLWGRVPVGVGKAGPGSPSCTTPPARSRRSGARAGGALGAAPAPGIRMELGMGQKRTLAHRLGPAQVHGQCQPAARQQGAGSGRDQMPGLQLQAAPRAGKAWPLPPTALLAALPLARWDGNPLGSADPELTPNICN